MKVVKKWVAKRWSKRFVHYQQKWIQHAIENQFNIFQKNLYEASDTEFGKTFGFSEITSYEEFNAAVPIQNYESLSPYIEKIQDGAQDVLWKDRPIYFAKTSGTTSGAKYIPISRQSMPYHISGARQTLLNYINQSQNAQFLSGKMIFLQGSPVLDTVHGIPTGRLSGIVAHHVPSYLHANRLPSWETNCIEDWEEKVEAIIQETMHQNMTLISGIPPWMIMYFERLMEKTGKKIGDIFPNLQVLITGGVNYDPYRQQILDLIGRDIDVIQTFPASEGFFAYQDTLEQEDLLLLLNHGMLYQFIPLSEYGKPHATRLTIGEVEIGVDYAFIITSNAGLWAYDIGDTVRFTSLDPFRIKVTGRTQHYTSAFGEHVIAYEVEESMKEALQKIPISIREFTLAPQVNPPDGETPYHEWFVELENIEEGTMEEFEKVLDEALRKRNPYYEDLRSGNILQQLKITKIQKDGFVNFMKKEGKLGGQNKIPRLKNDRSIAKGLEEFRI